MQRDRSIILAGRLLLLALLAYFGASTVNGLVALGLAPPVGGPAAEGEPAAETDTPARPRSDYAAIYARDIFNSVKGPARVPGGPGGGDSRVTRLRLRGTARGGAQGTFAIIEDLSSRTQALYREGDSVSANARLVKVHWDRVVLDEDGRQRTLPLPKEPDRSARPSLAAAPAPVAGAPGVRAVGRDAYVVDRREVEHAIAHPNEIFTQVRAVPYFQDGTAQGFRLFAIKVDSIFDRMGLKNGDVVQRINGVELTDPATSLSLLQDLRGSSRVQVDVVRNHQPTTLSYEIR